MDFARALRLDSQLARAASLAFVGAGGKTTALVRLARDLLNHTYEVVHATATTHMGVWQIASADHHIIATEIKHLETLRSPGLTLITGEREADRYNPVTAEVLNWLRANSAHRNIPLLIEADGSRRKPLKAPADHEPPIPEFSEHVVIVVGLQGLHSSLNNENVHRAELFSKLSGSPLDQPISPEAVVRTLLHPQGGLKNIPENAKRIVLLNQADNSRLQSIGGGMSKLLLEHYDAVIVASLQNNHLQVFEPGAAIILAAGDSSRFGSPKQLLDWKGKPFVRQVAETALQAGLAPVLVIIGSHAVEVESALKGLPVIIVPNREYANGQSTSIHAGLQALSPNTGSATFLLADQPQIPVEVIRALIELHAQELQPIVAPLVLEERRANPVLFDRVTFPDLLEVHGDVGGRAIFDKHPVTYLPWHDDILLFDVDKPEDYQSLLELE